MGTRETFLALGPYLLYLLGQQVECPILFPPFHSLPGVRAGEVLLGLQAAPDPLQRARCTGRPWPTSSPATAPCGRTPSTTCSRRTPHPASWAPCRSSAGPTPAPSNSSSVSFTVSHTLSFVPHHRPLPSLQTPEAGSWVIAQDDTLCSRTTWPELFEDTFFFS